ncbi:DUF5018 domain-containing protein [Flagellimonas sp. HMM57]|uniref:DUF5018 domain-containing protein n=1 Tax=unclassified Flagellimonas TaxID=2644544 RepID=UPI0013D24DBA|nr:MULTISPECIES: DUF5018 domain-containing protein [unclassified Flagellimonas]UII77799.1 DUF5018 domain-containing protein [Flagellimonas sp. HMM57]
MKRISILFLSLFVLAACSKDDDNDTGGDAKKSDANEITAFTFLASDNEALSQDVKATIDKGAKTVTAEVPVGTDVKALKPTIALSEKATVDPKDKTSRDFSEEVTYTVTAEDGSTNKYTITVIIGKSSAKAITGFKFLAADNDALSTDVEATIDEEEKTITAEAPVGTDVRGLVATITFSALASVTPENKTAVDFSDAVAYTVTASDGSAQKYTVTVNVEGSSAKAITSFTFLAADNDALSEDIDATIDEEGKTITAEVPSGTEISALRPTVEVSANATVSPGDKEVVDFSEAVEYVVTAADDSEQKYIITVTKALTDREILIALYNANRLNTTSWDIEEEDLSKWEGITVVNGRVTEISVVLKRISTIPESITGLTELEKLSLINNGIRTLPAGIGKLTKLKVLNLSLNQISELPQEMENLKGSLESFYFNNNRIGIYPNVISELTNLKILFLGANNLTELPPGIGNLSNLEQLDIDENSLNALPAAIGNLSNLKILKVPENELTTLPKEIGRLKKLEQLEIFWNNFSSFPEEMAGLESLDRLRIDRGDEELFSQAFIELIRRNEVNVFLLDN